MKIASLDLGSNSFLCLLCEADKKGIQKVHKDMVEIVRLGQDINKTQVLHPDALKRAKKCLESFKKEMDDFKPEKILAYATSAARDAKNQDEFFKIGKDLGIPIQIISGNKEAEVTYKGVFWGKSGAHQGSKNLLIDIGGGSTEIILGQDQQLLDSMSINMGAVRMTEKWITKHPVSSSELDQLKQDVVSKIGSNLDKIKKMNPDSVYAVAGTPTTLAAAEFKGKFSVDKIEGYTLTSERLDKWEKDLSLSTVDEIIHNLYIPQGRADIIISGVVILKTLLGVLGKASVQVSTQGVRYGIVADYFTNGEE